MKITEQLQREILKVYEAFWDSLLNVDLGVYDSVLDVDYRLIGTTENEVFYNKEEAISFLKATAEQLAGNLERRESKIKLEAVDRLVLITEQFDAYVLIDGDWSFYGKTRVSTWLQLQPQGWKIVQQHFSLPDTKAAEGQTIGLGKIAKENLELRDEIKRRTVELEIKNRELEIEAALERVRSTSLAMYTAQDLSKVVYVVFTELVKLDAKLDRCLILTVNPQTLGITWYLTGKEGLLSNNGFLVPDNQHPSHQAYLEGWRTKRKKWRYLLAGEEKKLVDAFGFSDTELAQLPDFIKADMAAVESIHLTISSDDFGCLIASSLVPLSEAHAGIVDRFTTVFNQTYTRFLDLQKAEAQAREAQIEAGLERVRSKSLAMHKTAELQSVIHTVHQELLNLNLSISGGSFIVINSEIDNEIHCWGSGGTAETSDEVHIPRFEKPFYTHLLERIKSGPGFFTEEYSQDEKIEFFTFLFQHQPWSKLGSKEKKETLSAQGGYTRSCAVSKHTSIFIINHFGEKFSESENAILIRFGKVFEQTYTRFLDLQKAEAQAREAQIEAALERVRSRTMAMQQSAELGAVAAELFAQMNQLVTNLWTCGFVLCEKDRDEDEWWLSMDGDFTRGFFLPNVGDYAHATLYEGWLKGEALRAVQLDGESLQQHYDWLMEIPVSRAIFEEMDAAGLARPDWQKLHAAYFSKGYLVLITRELCGEEETFKRFAQVFDQTFTRFLDLQKAEAQTKEAKIEGALEKVRSRTMGMQSSEELPEVANLLFTEVRALGIHAWSCGYNILGEDKKSATCCMSSEGTLQTPFQLRLWGENSFDEMGEFILSDHTMLVQELYGTALEEHYAYMKSFPDLKPTFDEIDRLGLSLPTYQINHLCKFTQGFILFITYEKVPESHAIFKRFTNVFDQTYTRFLDLKKAEAQAREAQIANALEKVRSRSLAMQSPDELIEVARLLREEMGALGVEELETSSIYIQDESSGMTQCWFTIKKPDNPEKAITDQMTLDLQDTWVGRKMDEFFHSKAKHTSILMQGKERIEWIRYCEKKSDLFGTSNFYGEKIPDRTYHLYKFSNGYIGAAAPGEISAESWDLLKRATAVFSFAYTRFRDLQMAQSSARAALRQASLDRIRADISSMRNADDLGRITPLVFNELTTLGIPFIRCGVFIVHENNSNVEIYLSTPEGKSLAVMTLPFSANEMTSKSVEAWKKGEVYIQHWNQTDFINWGKSMQEQGYVKDLKTYQGAEEAPESLHLHFVPFAQGLLYVGSTISLSQEQIDLVKALAKSFAIAYARYEDFVKLEKAKAEVESAMSELKATQSQLIQQEKLASLGQLTAGIAHEIKNPLNFVNNFSEVSIEMIEEILDSRLKTQDTRLKTEADEIEDEILEDIKRNLKKIHEHGSRANGIVTSMLQHSRGGTGKKEATDLNALIKEYVNLSFHGMRAGKNPIDVELAFDLNPKVKEVPLIKEDFIRVIINLCNNAFDAMRGKMYDPDSYREQSTKYEVEGGNNLDYLPKLAVSTILENGLVRISLADNGPGIPDEIKDKILQPFFTTKKGTEGTGLGLSITHDIIKAHGGSLSIESDPNGSIFTITIPTNS